MKILTLLDLGGQDQPMLARDIITEFRKFSCWVR